MNRDGIIKSGLLLGGGGVVLFIVRAFSYRDLDFWYLNWNLLLAALPLCFARALIKRLKTNLWSDWSNLALSLLWLGFLPNSFYLVTDFIHLPEVAKNTLLLDTVMIQLFTLAGLLLGYASVIQIHQQLRKRLSKTASIVFIAIVFLLCSFAIYLGRYLRWNTWDILVNPAGLLFDVSDSIINPDIAGLTLTTTFLFFGYISLGYAAILQFIPNLASNLSTPGKKAIKKVK